MPTVTFIDSAGVHRVVEARSGETLLEAARRSAIAIEGACEGATSCSTCHVIVDPFDYQRLPKPVRQELDMLDLAYGQTPTSRLACQLVVPERIENLTVRIPAQFPG